MPAAPNAGGGRRRAGPSALAVVLAAGVAVTAEGFTQDAYRVFRKDGREVKREKFTWTYGAEPKYTCERAPQESRAASLVTVFQLRLVTVTLWFLVR